MSRSVAIVVLAGNESPGNVAVNQPLGRLHLTSSYETSHRRQRERERERERERIRPVMRATNTRVAHMMRSEAS